MKIELKISNLGPVPNFKNNKRAIRLKNGSQMIVTDKRTKEWMEKAIRDFESQLSSLTRTIEGGISTGQLPRSLTVLSVPLDDSRHWISELLITDKGVPRGEEGAIVLIEEI